jgi:hypothetical protein
MLGELPRQCGADRIMLLYEPAHQAQSISEFVRIENDNTGVEQQRLVSAASMPHAVEPNAIAVEIVADVRALDGFGLVQGRQRRCVDRAGADQENAIKHPLKAFQHVDDWRLDPVVRIEMGDDGDLAGHGYFFNRAMAR